MTPRALAAVMVSALLAISCSTTSATSNLELAKSDRVLGLDDDVRVEATVYRDPHRPYGRVRIVCEIENRRPEPIVVYHDHSLPIYDPDTRTFTVNVGAELPHGNSQPIEILSAERRILEQIVSLHSIPPLLKRVGNVIRVRLHFLKDAIGFGEQYQETETDVMRWAEYKRTVDTSTVPVY
ncbi:MAG: hypothetical protein KY432_02445 [Acidobacteria bacterium]|nr:hypothetical protein [Acidobacteriota bacterium]